MLTDPSAAESVPSHRLSFLPCQPHALVWHSPFTPALPAGRAEGEREVTGAARIELIYLPPFQALRSNPRAAGMKLKQQREPSGFRVAGLGLQSRDWPSSSVTLARHRVGKRPDELEL